METSGLLPATKFARRECDEWKSTLDEKVAANWIGPFFYAIGRRESLDPAQVEAFQKSLAWLDEELGDGHSFKESDRPICDLRAAEWATYAFPGAGLIERVPAFGRFKEVFGLEQGSLPRLEKFLAPWNERLA